MRVIQRIKDVATQIVLEESYRSEIFATHELAWLKVLQQYKHWMTCKDNREEVFTDCGKSMAVRRNKCYQFECQVVV